MVQALYVDRLGPYPKLLGAAACWDETRDARAYAGPDPVVAHPPCGAYSKQRPNHKKNDADCAPIALAQVRQFGGVLEHPKGSKLWNEPLHLPRPFRGNPSPPDRFGGFTVEVHQVEWGHVARKPTWLYCVGVSYKEVERMIAERPFPGRVPTHWMSGFREHSRRGQTGAAVPPGIKVCSGQQRNRTPPAFAELLIAIARAARKTPSSGR